MICESCQGTGDGARTGDNNCSICNGSGNVCDICGEACDTGADTCEVCREEVENNPDV